MTDERIEDISEILSGWCDGNMTHHAECGCGIAKIIPCIIEYDDGVKAPRKKARQRG